MRVEVKEALESMNMLRELTGPTITYLEKLKDTEFKVELGRGKGTHVNGWYPKGQCLTGPGPRDFERLAAASLLLVRFLIP